MHLKEGSEIAGKRMRFCSAHSWSTRTRPQTDECHNADPKRFRGNLPNTFRGGASPCGRSSGARCHCCNVRKAHSRNVRAFVSGQIGYNNSLKGDQIGFDNQRRIVDKICDFHDTLHVTLMAQLGYDGCKRDSNARRSASGQAGGHAEKYGPRFSKLEKLGVPLRAILLYKTAIESRVVST